MKILTVEQIRAAEEDAVKNGVFSFKELMENAAQGAADYLIENEIEDKKDIVVVCGCGNNGGDGLVLASKLKKSGCRVSVFFPLGLPVSNPAKEFTGLKDDLLEIDYIPEKCDILIDALFGIGLNRPVTEESARIIEQMNICKAKKVAIDLPSGCFANGRGKGLAFLADLTLTFIAEKPCFFLPPFNANCGKVRVIDIGVTIKEYAYLTIDGFKKKKRNLNSHKGTYGTLLTATGSYGMCGAAVLSTKAALVSGVGIVKSFVCDKNYAAFTSAVPEAVTVPVETFSSGTMAITGRQLKAGLEGADSLLLGCGIGRTPEAKELVKAILETVSIPIVLDADGINALVGNIEWLRRTKSSVIITPHSMELARLCDVSAEAIEESRPEFAKRIAVTYGAVVVLKGANTVVASPDGRVFFNTTGNPGMATGGSGDVLSGMIAARLAMGEKPLEAAQNSVWLHGFAADKALQKYSMEGLLPSDIIAELKTL